MLDEKTLNSIPACTLGSISDCVVNTNSQASLNRDPGMLQPFQHNLESTSISFYTYAKVQQR